MSSLLIFSTAGLIVGNRRDKLFKHKETLKPRTEILSKS
jgi:hypothetical protein